MQYAEILFQQKVGKEQSTLTYSLPAAKKIVIGQSVEVPFRRTTKKGLVWKIHNQKPDFKTLDIISHEEKALLPSPQCQLLDWIAQYYFTPLHKVSKLFLPKRIFERKPIKSRKKADEQITRAETKKLTNEQERVLTELKTTKLNKILIHGVTGSGKTELYTRIANNYIEQGRQVLILVPEISLTPQIIEYFEKSLGQRAAIIHSKRSEGERYKAWESIWNNEAKLVIGSRSAIFSPFQDLAAVIVDEEHEYSYKQDQAPRYSIEKILEKMQTIDPKLKVILGSATPKIESRETIKTLELKERIGTAELPEIELVDLREEFQKKNYSIFSDRLHEEITQALERKEQILLFLNRRGSASSIVCRDCGHTHNCTNCESAMTFHSKTLSTPSTICHHCGQISSVPVTCPECEGPNIRYLGIGTQKIESETLKTFPNARVLRADKDTSATKNGFEEIYKKFRNHEADILIGTQMIAKGLHLPKVSLVGVVLADIGMNIPDFRSTERNFQLMTQVAGRAGRSKTKGTVIIQTYNPDHLSLKFSQENNYQKFFEYERKQRKLLNNPPFSQLCKLTIQSPTLQQCQATTEKLEKLLWKSARESEITENLEINYYPAYLTRLRGKYQYIILIKDISKNHLIHKLLENLPKEYIMDTNIKIDIDPISTT